MKNKITTFKNFLLVLSFWIGTASFLQAQTPFITTWQTNNSGASNNTSITIPTNSAYTYSYDVDWENDGIFDDFGVTGNITHNYGAIGSYQVAIKGVFPSIYFQGQGDNDKIISIDQWGNIAWQSMSSSFFNCTNLLYTAIDTPDLSAVTNMKSMFAYASSFNGDLSNWNVSNITNMQEIFWFASSFNEDLNDWNVDNVTQMDGMFFGASSFNGDLDNWNVDNVTNMHSMFYDAILFNGNISTWNVANVTDMSNMFKNTSSFNGDLSTWNVANVSNMSSMFNASAFNGELSNWDVSNVTDMNGMFYSASSFNGNLSEWNVANVNNMANMFAYANSFNKDLSAWNVISVTYMSHMFAYTSFNTDISNWDVSNVSHMNGMFNNATSFNVDISNWNVANVTNMISMFNNANSFNQNLGSWNIANVNKMLQMLDASGMSTENYDNTLIGWASQSVQSYVKLGVYGLNYCNGETARNILSSYNWTITGDILDCTSICESSPNNTQINITTPTTALATWDAVPEATNYQVWYKIKGTSNWIITGATSPQRNLPNLTKNKYYQYKVRSNCTSGWSDFSDIEEFYSSICDIIPTGIASIYLDNTRMRIRWDNIDEVKAKVRYKEVGTSTWYTQNSADGNNYVYINDLTPNATYQYRVRSNCEGNNWSAYSDSYYHDLMPASRLAANESSTAAKIYPNPVNDLLNIEFETNIDKKINIIIHDHLGKVIHTMNASYPKGIQRESIDVSSLANGYYFITIQGNEMMETFKFVKIK